MKAPNHVPEAAQNSIVFSVLLVIIVWSRSTKDFNI